ncbi:MAG: MFS transporter [Kiritimatiellia bacterium]|nr:MFS transporter [Kiritimatiellia bacterium]
MNARTTSPLRSSLRRIVIGGTLAMVFATGTGSPATTQFFRALGADEFHFGMIGGLPLILLSFQFLGAAFVNRAAHRKPTFLFCLIACRLLYLPLAFLPALMPDASPAGRMAVVLALLGMSAALHNFAIPFWFSWVADLVPGRVLNRFWGGRQFWMHLSWTASFLAVTAYLLGFPHPVTVAFPVLVCVAVAAGIVDILLFIRVREPPNVQMPDLSPASAFLEPLRHVEYRGFLSYSCAWSFSTMFAAAFMQLYVLKEIGLETWKTTLIWCLAGVGIALAAPIWGRLADRHGQRPVINVSMAAKSMIVVVFILLTPENVLWLLPICFLIDGALNSGSMVAQNGYMLSIAPRENRSMFIAAILGLSGIAGGIAAMLAGALLRGIGPGRVEWMGRSWNAYHVVFALSFLFRLLCIPLARRIREPGSSHPSHVLNDVIAETPLRFLRFPVGLYRRINPR